MSTISKHALATLMSLGIFACHGSDPAHTEDSDDEWSAPVSGWTMRVAPGTRLLDYPAILPAQRDGAFIGLEKDLLIGSGNASEQTFYNVLDVAVADDGRIFVVDGGNDRVQVFSSEGDYEMTLGRFGRGPGEFIYPVSGAIAGNRLAVFDDGSYLLSLWTLDGEYVESHRFAHQLFAMDGTDDGLLVGRYRQSSAQGQGIAIAGLSLEGEKTVEFALLPEPRPPTISRSAGGGTTSFSVPAVAASPWFAVARTGEVFVTRGDEYQILGFSPAGQARWALRVASPREPLTDTEIDATVSRFVSANFSAAEISNVQWPEARPALTSGGLRRRNPSLAVDGHGHLYVFPYVPAGIDVTERPVDVYSLGGERLFSGMMPNRPWTTARGSHVYAIERHPESSEYVVVRYLLEEPF